VADDPIRTLTVSARDVVDHVFNVAAYPHRHLAVVQVAKIGTPNSQIPLVMNAVEMLSQIGWDLAGFSMENHTVVAVLQRPRY
jgi:hypothetical protein